jgi:nitrogen-specific signal transduction histidine kinase
VPRDVTERHTLELDLRQAQKMDALGRLAGGIAHDFNNLLTAIMGYASLLTRSLGRQGAAADDAEEILKASQRAALLTQQLLAFSRRQVVQMKPVALNDLVRDMQRMLERIIGEDVHLVADLDTRLPLVQGDPGQLQQVLLNLAVNARDAMPGGGTLTLRTRPVVLNQRQAGDPALRPGVYALLEVTDTGVGMDEATRARIFEPFFTTKDRVGGTGLGLAMVYGIVRQASGDVSVTSEPLQGTTFRIFLPELPASAETVADPAIAASDALPRGNETILVVEDQPQIKELSCRMLREQGYDVLGTTDARQALEICARHDGPIHLLVTDMVMPRMGGAELAQAARPLRPEMKVLYMSGHTDSSAVHNGAAAERVPFLQKPFTPRELGSRVREALGLTSLER